MHGAAARRFPRSNRKVGVLTLGSLAARKCPAPGVESRAAASFKLGPVAR